LQSPVKTSIVDEILGGVYGPMGPEQRIILIFYKKHFKFSFDMPFKRAFWRCKKHVWEKIAGPKIGKSVSSSWRGGRSRSKIT